MKTIVEKSMLGRAWVVSDCDATSNDDDLMRCILHNRGVADSDIEKFLNPSIHSYMPDPFVLRDCDRAVEIISDAVQKKERIAVYGDYDVDGITSTAIFIQYLRAIGADVIWHLPTREGEGYGLNSDAIQDLYNQGARLLITVDCGISGGG